jgi:hypothetical protein
VDLAGAQAAVSEEALTLGVLGAETSAEDADDSSGYMKFTCNRI